MNRLLIAVALLAVGATPAGARIDAVLCLERDEIGNRLASRHGEHPSAAGLASNGQLLEVFAAANGTWTIVLTDAEGTSCVVASGEAWSAESVNADPAGS